MEACTRMRPSGQLAMLLAVQHVSHSSTTVYWYDSVVLVATVLQLECAHATFPGGVMVGVWCLRCAERTAVPTCVSAAKQSHVCHETGRHCRLSGSQN